MAPPCLGGGQWTALPLSWARPPPASPLSALPAWAASTVVSRMRPSEDLFWWWILTLHHRLKWVPESGSIISSDGKECSLKTGKVGRLVSAWGCQRSELAVGRGESGEERQCLVGSHEVRVSRTSQMPTQSEAGGNSLGLTWGTLWREEILNPWPLHLISWGCSAWFGLLVLPPWLWEIHSS